MASKKKKATKKLPARDALGRFIKSAITSKPKEKQKPTPVESPVVVTSIRALRGIWDQISRAVEKSFEEDRPVKKRKHVVDSPQESSEVPKDEREFLKEAILALFRDVAKAYEKRINVLIHKADNADGTVDIEIRFRPVSEPDNFLVGLEHVFGILRPPILDVPKNVWYRISAFFSRHSGQQPGKPPPPEDYTLLKKYSRELVNTNVVRTADESGIVFSGAREMVKNVQATDWYDVDALALRAHIGPTKPEY